MLTALHPVLMVRDVARAVEFYRGLGFTSPFHDERYAVLQRDAVELHLQWHDASHWVARLDRPTYRFVVRDVDQLFAELRPLERGLDAKPPMNTAWGTREFHLRDLDGNGLQFYRPLGH